MKLNILDIETEIKENGWLEVTNPIYFVNGTNPTDDGLYSYTIFGRPGSKERQERYGWINLKRRFIHPVAYDLLKNLGRQFENIILGKKFYRLDEEGNLIEDEENGKTGIDFLYKNFNKIKIKETGTKSRTKKISLKEELKPNEVFITKFIVCPAYIRDFNPNSNNRGGVSQDEVNKMYSKLLSLTSNLTEDKSVSLDLYNMITESNIQTIINRIYVYFIEKLAHKNGHIHQAMLGKTIDYSTRSVISAPNFYSNTYDKQEVLFGYTGVPLTQLVVLFFPFYVNYIQNFMLQHEMDVKIVQYKNKKSENVTDKLNIREIFTEDLIKKLLNVFVRTEEYRFQTLRLEDKNGNIYILEMFKNELGREFTLMDLIFLSTYDIVQDKHVYVSRYPIDSRNNIYPSKIKILSTRKTESKTINNTYFANYPHIIPDYPCQSKDLIMTVIPNNSYLAGLGGDYDGDTVSLRSVYSKEANEEAEKLLNSKVNLLGQDGKLIRSVGNEAIQALYTLTKE